MSITEIHNNVCRLIQRIAAANMAADLMYPFNIGFNLRSFRIHGGYPSLICLGYGLRCWAPIRKICTLCFRLLLERVVGSWQISGTAKLIAVQKQSRQLERNEDGCASTAKLSAMADDEHFRTSHIQVCLAHY